VSSPADAGHRATLEALRRVIRRIEHARPIRPTPEAVEDVVGGVYEQTAAGPLLVIRHVFSIGHRHGRLPLAAALDASPAALALIGRLDTPVAGIRDLLFLDCETTGLAGGTGTYAFLVGAGYFEDDRFVLSQFFMRDFDDEPALLAALAGLLDRRRALVTFNGSGFDMPLLETRFILARRRWPVGCDQLDLLRPARRVWAARFADCRLATLEREVLGVARQADIPGELIPALYFDFLRHRRAAPLRAVFTHNRDDVLSLVGLLGWFGAALGGRGDVVTTPRDLAGLGRLCERIDPERSADYYRRALAGGLDGAEAHRVRLHLALLAKRRAEWEAACALWEEATAAVVFDLRPWEELAKYWEHRRRDHVRACSVVARAVELARALGASARALEALVHRRARLERRLGSGGSPRDAPGVK
jgi:uncharacterized protein YprB with RNaseH-like and TPR domain